MEASKLGTTSLAVATTFFFIALVGVGMRIWALHIRSRSWKIGDTLVIVSIFFQCALLATLYYGVLQGGLGHHASDLSLQTMTRLFKGFVGQSVTWIIATALIKLSVLFFYLEIFRFQKTTRWAIFGLIYFIGIYAVASLMCVFTICKPFPKIWNTALPGRCGNIMSAMFATAVINCVEDLVVVIIPLPVIWKLQMSMQKKLGLSALIGIGFVIFGINIARLALASPTDQSDPSYNLAYQALFINLEVHIGLITACIPLIRPIFSRKKPTTTSAYTGPSGYVIKSNSDGYAPILYKGRLEKLDKNISMTESFESAPLSQHERQPSL